ncbi:hypothetical protein PFICI_12148 [Pestalotiopsis fici W106-1]|uniref:Uncharacterized protein n=1 Tax=Pestalotiopsis fici (strain W106-1 / CGMCC3.15140) TaxID=1229662 RepID=W3WV95_PESFW|nr:uncharacterized protein PFICI_12148 [Pestalotiopsis fici W106-1]ETS76761.1 hypothetical protein PFICI_12148 [Pestalotiopsis fici W106-1]
MSFQFVDNAAIDDKTRKLIRSHAAKGKSAGKGRARRRPHQTPEQPTRDSRDANTQLECVDTSQDENLTLERPWYDGVSLLGVSFQMSSRTKNQFSRGDDSRSRSICYCKF